MKKVRTLSLILTALLTVANLPLSVNAAAEVTTTAVENFPAEATVSYTDGVTVTNKDEVKDGDVTNGYITVDRRPWWKKAGGQVGYGLERQLFSLYCDLESTETKAYYVSFKVRHHVIPVFLHNVRDDVETQQQFIGVMIDGVEAKIYNADNDAFVDASFRLPDERNGKFATCVAKLDTAITDGQINIEFRTGANRQDIPLDFDDITIWCESTEGDGEYNEGDTLIYSEDYNDRNGEYIDWSAPEKVSEGILYYKHNEAPLREIIYHNFDDAYKKFVTTDNGFVKDLKFSYASLNGGDGYDDGSYTFSAQMRVPNFYYCDFFEVASYIEYNKHEVNVTFTYTDGNEEKMETVKTEISSIWSDIEADVIVPYGSKLTSIEIDPTINEDFAGLEEDDKHNLLNNTIDIKNASLTLTSYPELNAGEDEVETNYLDGVTVFYENANAPEIQTEPEGGYDGHILVGPRANGNDYLTLNVNAPAVKERTYYIGFNVNTADGNTLRVRPYYNATTAESVEFDYEDAGYDDLEKWIEGLNDLAMTTAHWKGGLNNNYLVGNLGKNNVPAAWYPEKIEEDFTGRAGVQYIIPNVETYFEGYFTPADNASSMVFNFKPGIGASTATPIIIDDLKVWYKDGVNEVYVCQEGFNSEDVTVTETQFVSDEVTVTANGGAALTHVIDCDNIKYTPADSTKPIVLTYDLDISDEDAVEGKYSFSARIKPVNENDSVRATVTFKYSDDTSDTSYIEIGKGWNTIGKSEWLERYPDLESIVVTIDCGEDGVMIRDDILTIKYKYAAGRPNTGIAMILFKKLQGGMVKPINGHMLVDQRIGNEVNYLTFNLDTPVEADKTYYIGFDINTTDGKTVQIRPFYDAETKESITGRAPDGSDIGKAAYKDGGFNNTYLVNTKGNRIQADWYGVTNSDGTEGPKELVIYTITGSAQHFEAYFTPVKDAKTLKFHFNRGTASNHTSPMIIDNLKVWYMDGDEKVYVYEEDFNCAELPESTVIYGNNGVGVSHVNDAKKSDKEEESVSDGNLLIGQRQGSEANYVTFDSGAKAEAGKTYYVSFNISTTDKNNVQIRPIYADTTKESLTGRAPDGSDIGLPDYTDGGFNSNYLVGSDKNRLPEAWYGASNADGSVGPKELVMYTVTGIEQYFEGYFTPVESADSIKFMFNRGTASNQTSPMLLDDLKVWYMDGDKKVYVYEENFDSDNSPVGATIVGNNGVSVSRFIVD